MNCKCRLKIILVILTFLFSYSNLKAEEELGSQHSVGLGFLYDYEYSEPHLMHLRAGKSATSDTWANIGILYNYKNTFIKNDYLSEIELDTSFQFLTQSYWSNGTGTMEDIDVEIFNLRALYGLQLSSKLMLKSGLGYRYLYHYWQNRQSTTGAYGYDREQDYTYIPFLIELNSSKGILKFEYDYIIEGNNTSYLGYLGGTNKDLDFKNNDGYMWKISFEEEINGIIYEPYYEFLRIEDSNTVSGSVEPQNTTNEIGFKIKKEFNSKRASVSNYKKIITNDEYYIGMQVLMSEVESGFSSPTGSAKIEEEDTGLSIVSGMKIIDDIKGLPLRLYLEVAFNQFGDSISSCNSGDTLTTDGRYINGKFAAGSVLSCGANNNDVVIKSYSTSVGIKPSFMVIDNLFLNGNIGLHSWNQVENDFWPGTNYSRTEYKGTDLYYGVGASYKIKSFTAEIGYLEHNMYYDAKSLTGEIKYNF